MRDTPGFIVHYDNEEVSSRASADDDQLASATRRIGNPKLENE